jgi:oxalate---CoA ligase
VREIARLLGPEYPFYQLRSHGLRGGRIPTIEEMAEDYMRLVAAVRPHGPYLLGGHCNGAMIAWELARRLTAAGERVVLVAMVEPITLNARPGMRLLARVFEVFLRLVTSDTEQRKIRLGSLMSFVWRVIRQADKLLNERSGESEAGDGIDAPAPTSRKRDRQVAGKYLQLQKEYRRTMAGYFPSPVAANVFCLTAASHKRSAFFSGQAWRGLAPKVEIAVVPGEHLTCITTHAEPLARELRTRIAALPDPDRQG